MSLSKRNSKMDTRGWGVCVPTAPYYSFTRLLLHDTTLKQYIRVNEFGETTTKFASRKAQLAITRAILKQHFSLTFTLPPNYIVPNIPFHVQYLRWAISLLQIDPIYEKCFILDINCGPSAITDLLGSRLYPHCQFLGTDTDSQSVTTARRLLASNRLSENVTFKHTLPTVPLLDPKVWGKTLPDLALANPSFINGTVRHPIDEDKNGGVITIEGDDENDAIITIESDKESEEDTDTDDEYSSFDLSFARHLATESTKVAYISVFSTILPTRTSATEMSQFLLSPSIRAKDVVQVRLNAGPIDRFAVSWRFGSPRSIVTMWRNITDSEWDAVLHVTPNRVYANRLTLEQILELWCSVMSKLDWEKVSDEEAVKVLGKRRRYEYEFGTEENRSEEEHDGISQVMKKLAYNQEDELLLKGTVMLSAEYEYTFFIQFDWLHRRGIEMYKAYKIADEVCGLIKQRLDENLPY